MKSLLIWILTAAAIFLLALQGFRAALSAETEPRGGSSGDPTTQPAREGSRNGSPGTSKSNRDSEREPRAAAKVELLRVPSQVVATLSMHAMNIDEGVLTPELRELLELSDQELKAAQAILDGHFMAHARAELKHATVVSRGERDNHDPPSQDRLIKVRIDPLGDALDEENAALQDNMTGLLGPSRGLAASSLIRQQLGNSGEGGEEVSFVRHNSDQGYRLEVKGLKKSRLRAGRYTTGAIYPAPDFSLLARYRHLADLANATE